MGISLALPGRLDWDNWFYGLFAGFIGGGASAVTSGVTLNLLDPKDFNLVTSKFYITVASIFVANGLLNMFMYLKQNPLPTITTVTKVQKTETGTEPPVVVTKMEQTTTESVPPKEKP
jgi:hypothetical protein